MMTHSWCLLERAGSHRGDGLLRTWFYGGKLIMSVLRSPWASVCDILAYKCPQLQSLYLRISCESFDEWATYVQGKRGKITPLADDKPAAWAYFFGKIHNLHDLRVSFSASLHSTEVEDSKNLILKNVM